VTSRWATSTKSSLQGWHALVTTCVSMGDVNLPRQRRWQDGPDSLRIPAPGACTKPTDVSPQHWPSTSGSLIPSQQRRCLTRPPNRPGRCITSAHAAASGSSKTVFKSQHRFRAVSRTCAAGSAARHIRQLRHDQTATSSPHLQSHRLAGTSPIKVGIGQKPSSGKTSPYAARAFCSARQRAPTLRCARPVREIRALALIWSRHRQTSSKNSRLAPC